MFKEVMHLCVNDYDSKRECYHRFQDTINRQDNERMIWRIRTLKVPNGEEDWCVPARFSYGVDIGSAMRYLFEEWLKTKIYICYLEYKERN